MKIEAKISPLLFQALGRGQYKNHPAVVSIRELLQNSRDAIIRANRTPDIQIVLNGSEPSTIECRDNGCGMSEYDILNKLLYVGAPTDKSDRKGAESVGGFGIGVKVVLFGCLPWTIQTHDIEFDSDAFFNAGESREIDYIDGTNVSLTVQKRLDLDDLLLAYGMIAFSDVPVTLTHDNQTEVVHFTGKLKEYKSTKLCHVYLTDDIQVFGQTLSGYAVYRLRGLVQFIERKDFKGFNVIIDINADNLDAQDPNYPLTTSREALKGNEWWEIYSLLSEFKENPLTTKSNYVEKDSQIKLYRDKTFEGRGRGNDDNDNDAANQENSGNVGRKSGLSIPILVKGRDSKPTTEERRILRLWGEIVQLVAHDNVFGVGIIESNSTLAARLEHGLYVYYLLNISKLPDLDKDGLIYYLWTLAIHEAVHVWQSGHNEEFTSLMNQISRESSELIGPALVRLKRSTGRRL
jgi:hypothetical protein